MTMYFRDSYGVVRNPQSIILIFRFVVCDLRCAVFGLRFSNTADRKPATPKKGQMKYINFINNGKQELYNLTDDPTEQNNLASKMPKLASSFKQQMIHWVTTNKVALPKVPHRLVLL